MRKLTFRIFGFGLLFSLLTGAIPGRAQEMPNAYQEVLKFLDRKGDFKAGVLKVNIPRSDLKMAIQGVSTPHRSDLAAGLLSQRGQVLWT